MIMENEASLRPDETVGRNFTVKYYLSFRENATLAVVCVFGQTKSGWFCERVYRGVAGREDCTAAMLAEMKQEALQCIASVMNARADQAQRRADRLRNEAKKVEDQIVRAR